MGLSITFRELKKAHEGVSIRIYQGLLARLLNRPLAFGYVVKLPAYSQPHRPGVNWMFNIYFNSQCHGGSAPSRDEAIQDAISFVRE